MTVHNFQAVLSVAMTIMASFQIKICLSQKNNTRVETIRHNRQETHYVPYNCHICNTVHPYTHLVIQKVMDEL